MYKMSTQVQRAESTLVIPSTLTLTRHSSLFMLLTVLSHPGGKSFQRSCICTAPELLVAMVAHASPLFAKQVI